MGTSSPRLCVLKREEKESYGFYLLQEKQNRGGLQDGDRVLEVNNFYIDDISHSEVSKKIRQSGNQLCLLVLEEKTYKQAVSQGQDLRGVARAWPCLSACQCHSATCVSLPVGEKGRFSVSVLAGGAADKAGVRKGDRLVSEACFINSFLTDEKSGDITILVIDSESEKKYMQKKMPILPSMAVPHNLPHRARKLRLICSPNGYGFMLNLETTALGRKCDGSIADKAGMKNGELLLEVNGQSVEKLAHDHVVDLVRISWKTVSLTTISPQGLDFYTKVGITFSDMKINNQGPALCIIPCFLSAARPVSASFCEETAEDEKETLITLDSALFFNCLNARQVVSGGSAQKAGLAEGDVVIQVNGRNVERKSKERASKMHISIFLKSTKGVFFMTPKRTTCVSLQNSIYRLSAVNR
uniref:PDZ domain containing 3b n=1 Tax=Salarias fasciatus TaxID=181472 RepID=A0A672HCX7_SALFA